VSGGDGRDQLNTNFQRVLCPKGPVRSLGSEIGIMSGN